MFYFLSQFKHSLYYLSLFVLLISTITSGCSQDNSSNNKPILIESAQISSPSTQTLSPELALVFKETCAQCHLNNNTGAPRSGDFSTWQKILSKGMDKTLERVLNGFGGMPPAGQCFECTPEELIELINHMSNNS